MTEKTNFGTEHSASARGMGLSISTKQSVEICNFLRYKSTTFAKGYLESVFKLEKPIPFKRFNRDTGHKPGMAAGRYPQKAAQQFLQLIKLVEANAHAKGLNVANLKITQILANRASVPMRGGRQQHGGRRTHVKIAVAEFKIPFKVKENKVKVAKSPQLSAGKSKTNKTEAAR